MMKLKTMSVLAAFIAIGQSASAQDGQATDKAEPVAEKAAQTNGQKITEIIAFETKKHSDLLDRMRAIPDRKEANALYQKERSDRRASSLKILELAKAAPTEKEVVVGITWSLGSFNAEQQKAAMALIMKHQLDNKDMGKLLYSLSKKGPAFEGYFRDIMMFSNSEKVRQSAAYHLAKNLLKDSNRKAEGIAISNQLLKWPGLKESYPRLYQATTTVLFVANNLSIGSKVPDIVGKDQDDVEFKLSDYKGKVVLLDFWGIW